MSDTQLILAPITCYLLATIVAVASGRARVVTAFLLILGGGSGVGVALWALLSNKVVTVDGWAITPFAQFSLRLDPLAAFFLLVISLPAIAAAWYGTGYLDAAGSDHRHASPAAIDALLGAFLASMSLVILADGVFPFLIAWELMSLVSFFLVIGDGHQATARRAGYIYMVMTHISAGFLLFSLLLLARHSGSFEFASFRDYIRFIGALGS